MAEEIKNEVSANNPSPNKNMTTCKSCGAAISKKAKHCPSCGAKNKPPLYKRAWFIFLVLVILGCIISAFGGGDETSNTNASESSKASSNKSTSSGEQKELPTASIEELEASVEDISYDELARNPDSHKGSLVKFTGEVIQVIEPYSWSDTTVYRICVSKNEWGYDYEDVIYVEYVLPEGASRILENDEVTVYGNCTGLESYESVLGGKISIPKLQAERIEYIGSVE